MCERSWQQCPLSSQINVSTGPPASAAMRVAFSIGVMVSSPPCTISSGQRIFAAAPSRSMHSKNVRASSTEREPLT